MRVRFTRRVDRGMWKVGNAFTVEVVSRGRENHFFKVTDHKFGGKFDHVSKPYRLWNSANRDAARQAKMLGSYLGRLVGRG